MKKLFFLFIIQLFCFNLGFTQSNRTQLIDIKHIVLDLKFDWKKKQAFGKATILLTPLVKTNKINLDAGFLTINSIKQNGKPLKFNYDGSDKVAGLEILLDKIYQPNQNISLKIDYHTNWVNQSDPKKAF